MALTHRAGLGGGFVMGSGRETVGAKARRYLDEDRVEIPRATDEAAYVRVLGAEPYRVVRVDGAWTCTCPARVARCHVVAAERATAPRRPLRRRFSAEEIAGLRREVRRRRLEEDEALHERDRMLFTNEAAQEPAE